MEIDLKITKDSLDKLTWGDWETIQDGNIGYREARRLIAIFMVDKNGDSVPLNEAMETLKKLTTTEMRLVVENFTKAISKEVNDLVPNEKGLD